MKLFRALTFTVLVLSLLASFASTGFARDRRDNYDRHDRYYGHDRYDDRVRYYQPAPPRVVYYEPAYPVYYRPYAPVYAAPYYGPSVGFSFNFR